MNRKTKLKDWVRKLLEENPIITYGPSVMVEWRCAYTREICPQRIRQDWWEDGDFRFGYEALRADAGFIPVSELDLTSQTAAEQQTCE